MPCGGRRPPSSLSPRDCWPARNRAFTIFGSVIGIGLACLYLAGGIDFLRDRFRHPWLDFLLCVVAAWLFAVALLMLALLVSPVTR